MSLEVFFSQKLGLLKMATQLCKTEESVHQGPLREPLHPQLSGDSGAQPRVDLFCRMHLQSCWNEILLQTLK